MRFLTRSAAKPPRAKPPRRGRMGKIVLAAAALALLAGLGAGGALFVTSGRAAIVSAAAATALDKAAAHIGFTVQSVAVAGRVRESRASILAALGVQRGAPLLAVDLGAAKARLEALPWVRSADVERLLPDRLFVRLVERRPLAFWQRNEKLELLADDGKVVPGARLDDYGSLIVLVGDDAPKLAASLLAMLATEPTLMPHVAAAVRVGGRRWNVKLDSGIDVALPEQDPASAWHRLAALEKSDQLLDRDILAVDLRLPDRLVVRLPQPPAKPQKKKRREGGKPT